MRVPKCGIKKAIDSASDPYLNKASPTDNTSCSKCGAFYHNKRWSLEALAKAAPKERKGETILCPACQKIRDGFVGGFVTIAGSFATAHNEEIINLIRNKEKRAIYHNPLERIIEIKETADGMKISTTTEKLAQRIGAILKKAYKGELEYKWSEDVKLARVSWRREQ